jgi:hypothetical protein
MNLETIGEGFEWPGTPRIKAALEVLGFGPRNHMSGLFGIPSASGRSARGAGRLGAYQEHREEHRARYGSLLEHVILLAARLVARSYPRIGKSHPLPACYFLFLPNVV